MLNQNKSSIYVTTRYYYINPKKILKVAEKGIGNLYEVLNHVNKKDIECFIKPIRILFRKIKENHCSNGAQGFLMNS